ncbi:sulfotransferase family 2 domain-containing protein [Jiella sonneratiae]|uniref:Sulfotransferase family 2 domain-containing protein n=1 Tax=Jiella sonneratiae TaxID=2816856 RepID=A0ABS3J7F8_9HYPH|nr:sulfotransferase family 2 domain-containing protein [Jiella sonneratiae]MBO0905080.1 sulfotransferase family 2 domain-containing protein [Jiella sonneratiae]
MLFDELKLIFLHVPKTGGTSVRAAILETFGADRVYSDYGERPAHPASPVNLDPEGYLRSIEAEGHPDLTGMSAVVGHFWPKKYERMTHCLRAMVLRDPLDRAISHYFYRLSRDPVLGPLGETFRQFVMRDKVRSLYTQFYFRDVDMNWFDLILDHRELSSDWVGSIEALGLDPTLKHEKNVTASRMEGYDERKAELMADSRTLEWARSLMQDDLRFYETHVASR